MRILFYLPVVTGWWFEAILTPLIARLTREHDVHVMAPAPWRNTGIGPRERQLCIEYGVQWHIVHDEDHPGMRTRPERQASIISYVNALAPDYVLCRSADCETPREFSAPVRYIMEGGASPLHMPADWVAFQSAPFDHGILPDLDDDAIAELDRFIAPYWNALQNGPAVRNASMSAARPKGLPNDKPVIFLPLEYEHEENFFTMHRIGATPNARLVKQVVERIGDDFFLAITNHPLNELHIDNSALVATVASLGGRARLFPRTNAEGLSHTELLMRDADGVLLGDSKLFAMAGFYGTPSLRRSYFDTGEWLNAYTDFDSFLPAVAQGNTRRPDIDKARIWFAYHVANNVIAPNDPDLGAAEILAHIDRPVDRGRWQAGMARFIAENMELAA